MAEFIELIGGEFLMGSDDYYPDESPQRLVSIEGFSMAATTVTNSDFSKFVEETGFATEAEKSPDPAMYPGADAGDLIPGGLVFSMTRGPVSLDNYGNWWAWTPGADWRHPTGPDSSIEGMDEHPVVQVSHGDATAYCDWADLQLPSEEEWEFAARGGLKGTDFTWGDDDPQETAPLANTWQGRFPYENTEVDGFTRTSPVGSYPVNGYGLFDMAGNVWEWTDSWYVSKSMVTEAANCCAPSAPTPEDSYDHHQDVKIPRKVVKGGSHLCTPQYCYRYRPAARQPQTIETATSHMGFRVIRR